MKICKNCNTKNNDINSFCTNCKQPFNDIKQKTNTEDLNKIPKIIKVLFIFVLVMLSLGLLQIQKNKIKQQVRNYFKQQLIQEVNKDTNKEKLLSDNTVAPNDYKINEHNTITAQPTKKYNFDGIVFPNDDDADIALTGEKLERIIDADKNEINFDDTVFPDDDRDAKKLISQIYIKFNKLGFFADNIQQTKNAMPAELEDITIPDTLNDNKQLQEIEFKKNKLILRLDSIDKYLNILIKLKNSNQQNLQSLRTRLKFCKKQLLEHKLNLSEDEPTLQEIGYIQKTLKQLNDLEIKIIQQENKKLSFKIKNFIKQNKADLIDFSILSILLILFIITMIKTSAYKIFISLTLLKTFLKEHKNLLILISSSLLFLFLAIASDGKFSAGFYTLLRITVTTTSCYIIYLEFIKKNIFFYLLLATAVLFNPIIQLHFHRDTWQTIDFFAGFLLIVYLIYIITKFVKK